MLLDIIADGDTQGCNSMPAGTKKRSRKLEIPWSRKLFSELVVCVETEEQLWNFFHEEYKNFKGSRLIWNTVAENIGRSADDCINKWASLRFNFKVNKKQ